MKTVRLPRRVPHRRASLRRRAARLSELPGKGGAVRWQTYTVFGYKGKQVRDQIHSADVVAAFDAFAANPRPGEVYNLGGGRENSASILECFQMLESRLGRSVPFAYEDTNRRGDHICYMSDLRKFRGHFPAWRITRPLDTIIDELVEFEQLRLECARS